MKTIKLPHTDLEVSRISYGTTGFDGTVPDAHGFALVEKYLAAEGNFIDTAHCYSFWVPGGDGESERFVGRAVKEFGRERMVIATKGGHVSMPPGYPRPDAFIDPELVARDLDESLDRLDLPFVDVYYLHRDDPRVPAEELIEATNEHVSSGRALCLGASNWSVERYRTANDYASRKGFQPFSILQNQWSLARPNWGDLTSPGAMRYIEDSERDALIGSGIVVAAYTAAAAGYFATDGAKGGQFESPTTRRRLAAVLDLAKRREVSPTQIALAYLLNHPVMVLPVIGTLDQEHLGDALESINLELTPEEFAQLDAGGSVSR